MWTNASSRSLKDNFLQVDVEDVLTKVSGLPLYTWNYRAVAASVRHLGPTAEAFHAAFGLGNSDAHIGTQDISGVNMAAIQALTRQLRDKDQQIAELRREVDGLAHRLEQLVGTR